MNFTLNLTIKDADLRILAASGLRIAIARPVGNGAPNVAWLVFDPFMGNTVEWSEEYGLYASTTDVKQGARILKLSELPPKVADGKSYFFGRDQTPVFDPGDDPCALGSFQVENLMAVGSYPQLTFGLTQKAIINGRAVDASCINATMTPAQMTAVFTPRATVYVWLQNIYPSGAVITDVVSKTTQVEFNGGVTENTLEYDAAQGCFVAAANGKRGKVSIHKPTLVY
ncbi:MAG: hypothetical protein LBK73_07045 [Treponema sp.]|jgi:hypothetical protein|nr:hypothetical protein [Treponema sp.]